MTKTYKRIISLIISVIIAFSCITVSAQDIITNPESENNNSSVTDLSVNNPNENLTDEQYISAAIKALDDSWFKLKPVFGKDTNVCKIMKDELISLGYSDINVTIKQSDTQYISSNGDITYFYANPNDMQFMQTAQTPVKFNFIKGSATDEYSINAVIYWDADKVKETITSEIADKINNDSIKGENQSISQVENNLILPKIIDDKKWAIISWESSDDSIIAIDNSNQGTADTLFNPYIGKVTRPQQDKIVTLTATINFQYTSLDEAAITLTKTFDIIVKGTQSQGVVIDPNAQLQDYTSIWPNFRGNDNNNSITSAKTPRISDDAKLNWAYTLKAADDYYTNISDPIIVNDNIYIAVGNKMLILNKDGNVIASGALLDNIEYTCRLLYTNGKIIVPLPNGRLQAVAADSLNTVWYTSSLKSYIKDGAEYAHQNLSTLISHDGYIYYSTACADWETSFYGTILCIDETNGNTIWKYENNNAGYYWSGAVYMNNAIIIAGDDGILLSLDAKTGKEISRLDLGCSVRSTIVKNDNQVFAVSTDGKLHKIDVADDGSFSGYQSVQFAQYSTCTPTIYDNKAYVGGHQGEQNEYKGIMCIIDLQDMKVIQSVDTVAEIKSAPLVSTGYNGSVYAYFTCNNYPGGIYSIKLGSDQKDADIIFTPDEDSQNYCMASIICDENGTLYYTNDSGKLFSVSNTNKDSDNNPTETSKPEDSSSSQSSSQQSDSSITNTDDNTGDNQSSHNNGNYSTGDYVPIIIITIILVLSLVIIILLAVSKKKSSKQ